MESKIASKRALKGHLSRAVAFLNDVDDDTGLSLIKSRYAVFHELHAKFSDVMMAISAVDKETDENAIDEEMAKFENIYFQTDARFVDLISKRELNESIAIQARANNSVRLPKIQLPKFDGTLTEWKGFWDLFESMVDKNPSISCIQKFMYLKTALVREPLNMVQALSTTDENYASAVSMLKDRYDNERYLITAHIKALLEAVPARANNSNSLKAVIDIATKNIAALQSLQEPVEEWNSLIYYIIISKLDSETRRQYETTLQNNQIPPYEDLCKFVLNKCMSLNTSDSYEKKSAKYLWTSSVQCIVCQNDHKIFRCPVFKDMTPINRFQFVKTKKLCVNCLQSEHIAKNCKSGPCFKCSLKHNTLLHFDNSESTKVSDISRSGEKKNNLSNESSALPVVHEATSLSLTSYRANDVILSTAMIQIKDKDGTPHFFRAILDGGSQISFISKHCVQRLKLETKRIDQTVSVVGGSSQNFEYFVELQLSSLRGDYCIGIQCLVIPRIVKDFPNCDLPDSCTKILKHLKLADPGFNNEGGFDVLLSNEVFMDVVNPGVIDLPDSRLRALNTKLGWIVGGCLSYSPRSPTCLISISDSDYEMDHKLEKFWEMELDLSVKDSRKPETVCETQFQNSFFRDSEGRFHVQLPFTKSSFDFSHSRAFALKRLQSIEHRFQRDKEFKKLYCEFLEEYLKLGHMKPVSTACYNDPTAYYLPHHGVLKNSSTTTKLRVVFDGTSTFSNHDSLNSVLDSGPKLQNDQFKLLLRFSRYPIAFVADIEKMFRQIWVQETNRKYQRILWRSSVDEAVNEFELTTVTYGLNSSPFLAIRCLNQLAHENQKHDSIFSLIKNDFYVDNLLSGSFTLDDGKRIFKDLVTVMASAGFNLRQWASNSSCLMNYIQNSDVVKGEHIVESKDKINTLGFLWDVNSDQLTTPINVHFSNTITKRSILSELAQVYDPLGWLSPTLLIGKLILQQLWVEKLGWDDPVNNHIADIWERFRKQLVVLEGIQLNRYIGSQANLRIFGFCDASEKAFGSCLYTFDGNQMRLIIAKSRVAPLKPVTLARLELCAAVLLSRLMEIVHKQLLVEKNRCYLFTDSKIVLAWLGKPARNWKCFVSNRVSEIQECFPIKYWSHIRSNQNPADFVSRGLMPQDLQKTDLWWYGPAFVKENWEQDLESFETDVDIRPNTVLSFLAVFVNYERFSSYLKMIRVFAYFIRFIENARSPGSLKNFGTLTLMETDKSLHYLIKCVQNKHFQFPINSLKDGKNVSKNSPLASLNPFLDGNGIVRVGGRLSNSELNYQTKHPIILPSKDQFVTVLVRYEHFKNHHCGVDSTMTILRQKYWILKARSSIKRVLARCIVCIRFRPNPGKQLMGSLPTDRFKSVRPFYVIGLDYCGPFLTRATRCRGNITTKGFVCVFICFSTKAVHLELASDLSTQSFLAAFRRFTSRRGIPKTVYSDNGTNFLGASNQLKEWYDKLLSPQFETDVMREMITERIDWKFIPARSPEFGGLWESAVKVMKGCLIKSIGDQKLSIEEFNTLLAQIESTMNSRPLCYTTDLDKILTPSHFLIGDLLKALPDDSIDDFSGSLTKRFCYIQSLFHGYWRRWQREYLVELQSRQKNRNVMENLKVGEVVLIRAENLPPHKWAFGKVIKVFFGTDGLVRVVQLKTATGIVSRAVNKICKLGIFSSD